VYVQGVIVGENHRTSLSIPLPVWGLGISEISEQDAACNPQVFRFHHGKISFIQIDLFA
jgi:hypothetical protein